jgi:phenylacetate-CoA ligase
MTGKTYLFGDWVPAPTWDRRAVLDLCAQAESRREAMARYPLHKTFALLDRMRREWVDPASPRRARLLEVLPGELGLSRAMVALGLDRFPNLLDPRVLVKKVQTELMGVPRTTGYAFDPDTGTAKRWVPLGVLLHVLAGNGFLGGVSSLLEGLLTGNVSLLKVSSERSSFLFEVLESLRSHDADGVVAGGVAALEFPSSQTEIIEAFKQHVDGVVVWGGEAAVRAYRADVPARTRLIVFGPKLSLGVVTKAGLEEKGLQVVAQALAREVAIWDQSACTAPQLCYVEGKDAASRLAAALVTELTALDASLPAGPVETDAAVEIRKVRGLAVLDEAKGQGELHQAPRGLDWTVILTERRAPEPSPLHRTIRLIVYDALDQITGELSPLRGYVQTVGLVAALGELPHISGELARAGALRMLDLGKMATGEVDDPHDGAFDLPQLLSLVFHRFALPTEGHAWCDVLTAAERERWIDERLSELSWAQEDHPNLVQVFKGRRIEGRAGLADIPVMTRESTREQERVPVVGGYTSRSGGTTGEPRFSVYGGEEWEAMIARSVDVLRAVGLRRGDRVANCLTAGDLYGSFVSFDHINVRVGATSFAFAATRNAEAFVAAWREFGINVVQAMPTYLIPLLREARALESNLRFDTLIYGGMPLSRTDARWLADELGVTRCAAILGANDGGPIGFQCEAMSGNYYHLVDDFNYVECVDSASAPVPEGTMGRMLITSLGKFAYPLVRYEIGDLGRIVPGACSCGRTSRRLEFLGRIEDRVEWRGITFTHAQLAGLADEAGHSQLQIVVDEEQLCLRVEDALGADGGFHEAVEAFFRERAGREISFRIEHFQPGGIPRKAGSVKVTPVIDNRSRP